MKLSLGSFTIITPTGIKVYYVLICFNYFACSFFVSLFMSQPKMVVKNKIPLTLIAHKTADFVVVVPYMESITDGVGSVLLNSDLFNVWCISLLCFVIVRIVIRLVHPLAEKRPNALMNIPFNTTGLYFATTSEGPIKARSEITIVTFIAIGSMFSSTLCSDILLQSFMGSDAIPYFKTMLDLEKIPLKYEINMFVDKRILEASVKLGS